MVYGETAKHINPFFLLLKLPQTEKNRIGLAFPFFSWLQLDF